MRDIEISLNTVGALTLWTIGLGLIVLGFAAGEVFAELGLFFAGIGGVLNIRGFFCRQARREQAAFDLGREAMRSVH